MCSDEEKILKGWSEISKQHKSVDLSDEERAEIDITRLAYEQSKRSFFILGCSEFK